MTTNYQHRKVPGALVKLMKDYSGSWNKDLGGIGLIIEGPMVHGVVKVLWSQVPNSKSGHSQLAEWIRDARYVGVNGVSAIEIKYLRLIN